MDGHDKKVVGGKRVNQRGENKTEGACKKFIYQAAKGRKQCGKREGQSKGWWIRTERQGEKHCDFCVGASTNKQDM